MSDQTIELSKLVRKILLNPIGYFLVLVCGGVLLLRIDPFGLTRLMHLYSQDLLSVAMAACYQSGPGACGGQAPVPGAGTSDNDSGKTPVSVVLLNDSDLSFTGESWPPSYGLHARVLRAIRANRPRAVFIDIVFEDKRKDPSIAALRRELQQYAEMSIPVYAATFGPDRPLRPEVCDKDPSIAALCGELQQYAEMSIPVYAATFGPDRPLRPEVCDLVTPVLVPKYTDPLDRVVRLYYLHTQDEAERPTAALTVFHDQCGSDADEIEAIRLFWAVLPDSSWNDNWLTCRKRPAFPFWIFQDRAHDFRDDCPSTPTVPVRTLLAPSEADDPEIERHLGGGIILYGTHFAGSADLVNTPLHNELPGVYFHATALDNLITLGPQAVRQVEREIPYLRVESPDLFLLVVVGLWSVIAHTNQAYRRWRKDFYELIEQCIPFRVLKVLLKLLGNSTVLLLLLITLAAGLACLIGAGAWVAGSKINFLFAVAWNELLEISEKLEDTVGKTFADSQQSTLGNH